MSHLRVEQVSFGYRQRMVLHDVSLAIDAGGIVALLGPNGSGKTTLLKLILGLLRPAGGTVLLRDRSIHAMSHAELARQIAYVPQVHKESFAYRVRDVVLMGRMPYKPFFSRYNGADHRAAEDALTRLGVADLAERPYTEVSGGERQLTLIARAMAQGARTVVMDEPTNGLDYGNQIRLLERLKTLSREGYTFVFSTHHPDHALSVADRVVMMRDGTILQDGPAAATITPAGLERLYGIDVRVYAVEGDVPVCVPAVRFRFTRTPQAGERHG